MIIIVDTNIVFSALLNSSSRIGKILITAKAPIKFYSCTYLQTEIYKHRDKLLKLTKLSIVELEELQELITRKIIFIQEELIPKEDFIAAIKVVSSIDLNDTPFVALTTHLNGTLWTGDKELLNGLQQQNFKQTITTQQLIKVLDELES